MIKGGQAEKSKRLVFSPSFVKIPGTNMPL